MVGKLKMANNDYYIPLEIQEEIMKRLPVKSLLRFRSVSKPWKSLIHSSKFIADYRVQKHRLLVVSYDTEDINHTNPKYVSIVDDDTFPQRKLDLTLPISSKQPLLQIGSSHGLLCFFYINLAFLWNPTIRKSVSIDVPNVLDLSSKTFYGFGVCPVTCDPKLVKMLFNFESKESYTIEVFTKSSGVWRSPCGNLPRKSICITYSSEYIDGCIYWCSYDYTRLPNGSFKPSVLIMSFATTSEEFTEISLPNSLALKHVNCWISKLRESLAVIEINRTNLVYTVWMMMNHGDPKSFTKTYNISLADASWHVYAFTPSGKVIVKLKGDEDNGLYVYGPNSKPISFGISHSYYNSCYAETLLLLDH